MFGSGIGWAGIVREENPVCVPIRMIGRKAGVGDLGRNLHLKENVKYRAGRFANEVLLNGR